MRTCQQMKVIAKGAACKMIYRRTASAMMS